MKNNLFLASKKEKDNFQWLVLVTLVLGTLLGSLDRTVFNLALPDIIDNFKISVSTASWTSTAYILANAIFVPVWGKLGDVIGRKKVYLTGLTIFVVSSFLAGLAWNFGSLIVFRIFQALAVSADYPTAMAIIAVTFSQKNKSRAMGFWSASLASGAILGPLVGGPLIDYFGWRSVFLINVPLGILGFLMASKFIQESKSKIQKAHFDIKGAITLAIALSAMVLVLERGLSWGWLSLKSEIAYMIAIFFSIIFYFIERKHQEPIVDFQLFQNRVFLITLINTFVVFMGMMGSIFLIPLFVQNFLGYSATETGYLFLPMAVVLMLAAPLGARLGKKISSGKIIAGGTFIASGAFFLFSYLDPRSTALDIIIPFAIMAFGLGLGMSHRPNIIASSVNKSKTGSASALFVLTRNIAGAFGVALFATILSNGIKNNFLDIRQHTILNSTNPTVYKRVLALINLKAQINSYREVFVIASVLIFIGGIIALFINDKKQRMIVKE